MNYTLEARLPTPAEHRAMFEAVGWPPYTVEEVERALHHSFYGVVALQAGMIIAMGRVIGDRGKFYYVQDVAVRPDYQGQGLGRALMDHIMAWIAADTLDKAFVGLFATDVALEFYAHYGFAANHDGLTGMWTIVTRA